MFRMKVLAVISTLAKDIDRLNDAIRSLRKHSGDHPYEVLVVNNSEHSTITGLAPVDYIYSPGVNLGYVGALEFARRSYASDFLWSIQDDMTLDNDVLALLLAAMEKSPRLAVSSPVLVRNGVIPAGTRAGVFTNRQRTQWVNYPPADTPPDQIPADVKYSFVSGAGALFRSTALSEINGFNLDLYPLMHVDVDVCAKLLAKGWQMTLCPQARIHHQIQGSTPRLLGTTLDKHNRPIVEQQLADQSANDGVTHFDPIDTGLLFNVARRASFLFLEVSREAESRLEQVESQRREAESRLAQVESQRREAESRLAQVESQLHDVLHSTSWRVSAPIRSVGRFKRFWGQV